MDEILEFLDTQNWSGLARRGLSWLRVDGLAVRPGQLSLADVEDFIQKFMEFVHQNPEPFWIGVIKPQRSVAGVRKCLKRRFARFVGDHVGAGPTEAVVFRRHIMRLLARSKSEDFLHVETKGSRLYGLIEWFGDKSPRLTYRGNWWDLLESTDISSPFYTRRIWRNGCLTYADEDLTDGCRRLLGLCKRLAAARRLATGLIRSGWYHLVDLFSPVAAPNLIAMASQEHKPSAPTEFLDDMTAWADELLEALSRREHIALMCLINQVLGYPRPEWKTDRIAIRLGVTRQTIYNDRRKLLSRLSASLIDWTPPEVAIGLTVLNAWFESGRLDTPMLFETCEGNHEDAAHEPQPTAAG